MTEKRPSHVAYMTVHVGPYGTPSSTVAGYEDEEIVACGTEEYCRRMGHRVEAIVEPIGLHHTCVRAHVAARLARHGLCWLPADSISRRGPLAEIPDSPQAERM